MNIIRPIIPRSVEIRRPDVDFVLDDGGKGHGEGGEGEADGDAGDGVHGEAELAHEGVEEFVEEGDEDYDNDGVDVLHFVVGHAVELHAAGWRCC